MIKSGMNLQDSFLNQVRKDNQEIRVVLLDGNSLSGYVRGFDNFTVILSTHGAQHLIYKHAIAQIIQNRLPEQELTELPQVIEAPITEGAAQAREGHEASERPVGQPHESRPLREGREPREPREPRGPRPTNRPPREGREDRGREERGREDRGRDERGRGDRGREGRGREERGERSPEAPGRERLAAREGRPGKASPERSEADEGSRREKFNALDFSKIKVEEKPTPTASPEKAPDKGE